MTFRRDIGFLTVVALALTACAAPPNPAPSPETGKPGSPKPAPEISRAETSTITLEEFYQLHESGKALVFDARPSFVYQFGHIPGAINLPKSRCAEGIAKRDDEIKSALAAGKTLIVYCTGLTCPDAHAVATQLSISGHPASVFKGGWDAWREAGMPVE